MIVERVEALGGAVWTREVVQGSADRRRLRAAVDAGRLSRVARGVVALPGAEAIAVAMRLGGALTCVSALQHYGLPLVAPPAALHVTTPVTRGSHRGAVLHWTGTVLERGVAPLPLALSHALRCLPVPQWVAAADAAVARGLDLVDLRAHRPRRGRLEFDAALRAVDGRSQSLPESLVRVALRAAGLRPEVQPYVPGVGFVDLMVGGLIVEVDGFGYHRGRHEYREDRRRDRAAMAAGLRVARFTYEDVMHRLPTVVDEIAQLASVGRSSPSPR